MNWSEKTKRMKKLTSLQVLVWQLIYVDLRERPLGLLATGVIPSSLIDFTEFDISRYFNTRITIHWILFVTILIGFDRFVLPSSNSSFLLTFSWSPSLTEISKRIKQSGHSRSFNWNTGLRNETFNLQSSSSFFRADSDANKPGNSFSTSGSGLSKSILFYYSYSANLIIKSRIFEALRFFYSIAIDAKTKLNWTQIIIIIYLSNSHFPIAFCNPKHWNNQRMFPCSVRTIKIPLKIELEIIQIFFLLAIVFVSCQYLSIGTAILMKLAALPSCHYSRDVDLAQRRKSVVWFAPGILKMTIWRKEDMIWMIYD